MRNVSPGLVKFTVHSLKDLLQNLERREKVDQEIAALKMLIQRWEEEVGNQTQLKRHHRQGENVRILRRWFASHPGVALTTREICDRTGLAYSSVQAILQNKKDGWKRDKENRWSLA